MTSKTKATNGTHRRKTARKSVAAKTSGRRESWKKVFERYPVKEGYSPGPDANTRVLLAVIEKHPEAVEDVLGKAS